MQLKTKLQYYWLQRVYTNGPLLLSDTQLLEHDYIKTRVLVHEICALGEGSFSPACALSQSGSPWEMSN